jgi:hypothetical protein
MTSLAFSIGKNTLNDTVDSIKNKFTGGNKEEKPKVNWEDFNWPPFIKVIHFSLDELEGFSI